MAPRYDQLAVTTLCVDRESMARRTYYCMRFPGRWKAPLRRLGQSTTRRDVASIPIASLNAAVTALVPDCVVTLTRSGQGNEDEDWLIAYREVDARAIFALVAGWVRAQKARPEQIAAALTDLEPSDLTWAPVTIDLDTPGERHRALRLLTMDAAAALSAPGIVCPHGDLTFRRCAADTGAELVSWPPLRVEGKTPYSALISISAQTLPVSDEVLVYVHFGVRRWMPIKPILARDHGHSVYLEATVPYLSGLHNSPHFGRATIKRSRGKTPDDGTAYVTQWADPAARVLGEVGCLSQLPEPEQLAADPMVYLQRDEHPAALVYSTGMLTRERVSAGLAVADREPLMDWVAATLAPGLRPVDPLPRVPTRVYAGISRTVDSAARATALPGAVRDLVGPRLDIELFTDTREATSSAVDALATQFGVPMPEPSQLADHPVLVEIGPLTLGVRRPEVTIATSLDRGTGSVSDAVQTRVADIATALPRACNPTLALVEIGHPDSYQFAERGNDPLFAVRHGLARAGRLSQFVTAGTDASRERHEAAIDDLFRQLGVRPEKLPEPSRGTIPNRAALLAVWLIRTNRGGTWGVRRTVPVAVLIEPSGQLVQVHAPGVQWQPLHTGLLALAERSVDAANQSADSITEFIRQTLDEAVGAYPDTLLLTHAQNLRSGWRALTNTNAELDVLAFGTGRRDIDTFPGLRHVRVRTDDGDETPECFGVADATTGLSMGLWRYRHDRLYGSTGVKPATAARAVLGKSKIVPAPYQGRLVLKPNTQVWNHQFIELFVAGIQPGDDPDHWAALAHELRWAAPYSKATTVLPWPLHLARQVEEYLLPTTLSEVASSDRSLRAEGDGEFA